MPPREAVGVQTKVNWMATTYLLSFVPCWEAGLLWPHHLNFQEKPGHWICT